MKVGKTDRGFEYIEFVDRYNSVCSLQESSLAEDICVWFETNDADPKILVPGKGWQKVTYPEGTTFYTRMHLTVSMVKKLLPHLQSFIETGFLKRPRKKSKKK